MKGIQDLPAELFLEIFCLADLKTLISCRGVCSYWRELVLRAHIPSARKKLLRLYLKLLQSPVFYHTRSYILPNLQTFDRELYISRLPASTPDEFKTWILEWPAKAVIGWLWPGLSAKPPVDPPEFSLIKRGTNLLPPTTHGGPMISEATFLNPESGKYDLIYFPMMGAMGWRSSVWSEIGLDALDVSMLPIRRMPADYTFVRYSVKLAVGAGKGGDRVVGGMHRVGYCMTDCMGFSWVDYLEQELIFEENDLAESRPPARLTVIQTPPSPSDMVFLGTPQRARAHVVA
ncbi:hypothetical protein C8Q75DRAFT_811938 [Abortiporus biennis]|nr:hypothetical protein C8Q75DRAFT_811938 [Abortiporus biennis]